ncbi:hypothetical protein HN587_01090 [Candidatus Woesearchaeota archaeon]|nr:hypothetical protein [Candidatus Woesearchaeota archaeon]
MNKKAELLRAFVVTGLFLLAMAGALIVASPQTDMSSSISGMTSTEQDTLKGPQSAAGITIALMVFVLAAVLIANVVKLVKMRPVKQVKNIGHINSHIDSIDQQLQEIEQRIKTE